MRLLLGGLIHLWSSGVDTCVPTQRAKLQLGSVMGITASKDPRSNLLQIGASLSKDVHGQGREHI